ncbi:MAG: restriction endonuclease subunit S [Crocinitomicaceae bacterium]|nr:restriction endonuclease subunit S [Crocinitomicaceae bacterium]
MKSSYKRLGDFIHKIDVRNKNSQNTKLLGLSMTKEFRPHASNIIGTDLSRYKVVEHWQFACDFMSTIRVRKLPVVLQENDEQIIVSPAYTTFEVIDSNELHPEYLMMWFRRSEFDRYAYFCCDSAVRGGFNWDELCDVQLPVPSIEKQREIVKEYNTIVNRIKLNEQLNQKLEETAQALYKHWFVDFEFPNENGQPYKSSGGKLIYDSELDADIPEHWSSGRLDQFVTLSQGQVINAKTRHLVVKQGLPLLKITDLFNGTATMFIDSEKVDKKNIASKEDLIYTRTGQTGFIFRNKEGVVYNNCFKIIPIKNKLNKEYLFWFFNNPNTRRTMVELAAGSAQTDLTHSAFFTVSLVEPDNNTLALFENISVRICKTQLLKEKQNIQLEKLKTILLSKISVVNNKNEVVI